MPARLIEAAERADTELHHRNCSVSEDLHFSVIELIREARLFVDRMVTGSPREVPIDAFASSAQLEHTVLMPQKEISDNDDLIGLKDRRIKTLEETIDKLGLELKDIHVVTKYREDRIRDLNKEIQEFQDRAAELNKENYRLLHTSTQGPDTRETSEITIIVTRDDRRIAHIQQRI